MTGRPPTFVRVFARHVEHSDSPIAGEIVYTFYEGGRLLGHTTLDVGTKHALLARLSGITEETAIRGWRSESEAALADVGKTFFSLIIPPQAGSLLFNSPGGTLVLDVHDHEVPWELLHNGSTFLGAAIAIGRDLPGHHFDDIPGRPSVQVLVVGDPEGDLDGAAAEARYVENNCAKALTLLSNQYGMAWKVEAFVGSPEANKANVLIDRLLDDKAKVDIFHYAGHARLRTGTPGGSGLVLADGELRGYEARQMKSRPLVFVNGCRASRSSGSESFPMHGLMSGLAADFVAGGASGYIAPLWAVADDIARRFAELFYASVIGGETLGRATLQAKQALDSPDALAYTLFGHPERTLAIFAPRLTAGPFVNELGIQTIIELEREYSALELLAVNDLPWIFWDEEDISTWTGRVPIEEREREAAATALSAYVEEFGNRVLCGSKRFLAVVNAVTLREYLGRRGRARAESLNRRLLPFLELENFAMLVADLGQEEIDEIELVSKRPDIPPLATQSVYVFNKQPRFEASPLTYNLYQDFNPNIIEQYWSQLRRMVVRAAAEYSIPDTEREFGAGWFLAINAATSERLAKVGSQAVGRPE